MFKAIAIGLRSIVAPRRTIAAWPKGWAFWLTLAVAAAVLNMAPAMVAEVKSDSLAVAADTFGIWVLPVGFLIIVFGVTAILLAFSAYCAAFNWAALHLVSRTIAFRSVFLSALVTAFIASALGFVPAILLTLATLPADFPLQQSLDAIDGVTTFVSVFYLIILQSVLAGLGAGITFVLSLVSGLVALVVGLAIAWGIGVLFPDAGRYFSWIS